MLFRSVPVAVRCKGKVSFLLLTNVYYLPSCPHHLISVPALMRHGYSCTFRTGSCTVQKVSNNETVFIAALNPAENLCEVQGITPLPQLSTAFESCLLGAPLKVDERAQFLHEAFGHASRTTLKRLQRASALDGLDMSNVHLDFFCPACVQAKAHQRPYPKNRHFPTTKSPGERIHSDLCGEVTPSCLGGGAYFITLTDDFSNHVSVRILKHKNDAATAILNYINYVEKQLGQAVKFFHSDNGGEFISKALEQELKGRGIIPDIPPPYHPRSNGVAERMNRTLCESARAMLIAAADLGVPTSLWGEAICLAAYLHNRIRRKGQDLTPEELWSGTKPCVGHLKPFGTVAYVLKHGSERKKGAKFASKTEQGFLVGYCEHPFAYRVYRPEKHKVYVVQDVSFAPLMSTVRASPQTASKGRTSPLIAALAMLAVRTCPFVRILVRQFLRSST